ncbi:MULTISPECIES: hypothetical protein [Bacillus]|uniref:hypothetical protein n=1 Tax=Bacillus TaxID=1386 RepID=UPI00006B59BB|nr:MULTISPECIES: hypothetical protein [unclassified Bacillus (in: firmicutes)]EAR66145.1 hypothetical protein B14911_10437 [Bacillus sp. NRRL B-14911]
MKIRISGKVEKGWPQEGCEDKTLVVDTDTFNFSIEQHYSGGVTVKTSRKGRPLKLWYDKVEFLDESFEIRAD